MEFEAETRAWFGGAHAPDKARVSAASTKQMTRHCNGTVMTTFLACQKQSVTNFVMHQRGFKFKCMEFKAETRVSFDGTAHVHQTMPKFQPHPLSR